MRTFAFFYKSQVSGEGWGDGQMSISLRKVARDMETAQKLAREHMVKLLGEEQLKNFDLKKISDVTN